MYLSRICAVSILRHVLIVTVCDILRLRHILCEPFKAFLCRLSISIRQLPPAVCQHLRADRGRPRGADALSEGES